MSIWNQWRRTLARGILRVREGEKIHPAAIPFFLLLFPSRILGMIRRRAGDAIYDWRSDIYTIHGMRYSGDLFREWAAHGLPIGIPFRIISRSAGYLSIESISMIYFLTSGDGSDGNEWNLISVHVSFESAQKAMREYNAPRFRPDGSVYFYHAEIERWELQNG